MNAGVTLWVTFLAVVTGFPPQDGNGGGGGGESPSRLVQLLREGRIDETLAAIRRGEDVRAPDESGATPLHIAASMGASVVVGELISAGATVDAVAQDGSTPLSRAASAGRLDTAKLLVAGSANVNARDLAGATPLINAARAHSVGLVRFLLQQGANAGIRSNDGMTALDCAKQRRYTVRLPWMSHYWVFNWKSGRNDAMVVSLQRAVESQQGRL